MKCESLLVMVAEYSFGQEECHWPKGHKKSVIGLRDSVKDLSTYGDEYHSKLVKFAEELKKFGQQISCSEANIGRQ